jgi:predicted nuclease of restriction endonuclease-like (RecB) superfamily
MSNQTITFEKLVGSIQQVHTELAAQASRAVNVSLTLRNWLIGAYIAEYELRGEDRAQYGDTLLDRLAGELRQHQVSTCGKRQLYQYLLFYRIYPEIVRSVTAQFQPLIPQGITSDFEKMRSVTAHSKINPQTLINRLSYTHIEQLLAIDDDTKRSFYELECIRGGWSVRELKRQIGSLYYERTGLSLDKEKLAELTQQAAEKAEPALAIRDPYIFEFLGLKPAEVMSESHLEDRLIDRLEAFLLELGHGFCFEARQKRILLGDEYNFVDLVFYHRILKCHVLVDLKLEPFSHENIGQLNTYVSWYRKNMMTDGDNPPVGILLCTEKNHVLAEYALAGMDNHLFVSKYQLELPDKETMQRFVEEQLKNEKTYK